MTLITALVSLFVGLLAGTAATYFALQRHLSAEKAARAVAEARIEEESRRGALLVEAKAAETARAEEEGRRALEEERRRAAQMLEAKDAALARAEEAARQALEEERQRSREAAEEKAAARREREETLAAQVSALRKEFEGIALRLVHDESAALRTQHRETLDALLSPLKADLKGFNENYLKGNATMEEGLRRFFSETEQIRSTAENLASALLAQNKSQGNWGEAILENLLEASGLTKGIHYRTQMGVEGDEETGSRLIPDVVVTLSDGNRLIIDAKVSITAYTRYCNAPSGEARRTALKEHVDSVRAHVRELASKAYHSQVSGSLDYVLMFIPNEGAYLAAVEECPSLLTEAYAQKVIIVSASSLLMTLKLVHTLWQNQQLSRETQHIYDSATKIYNKMCSFCDNFVKMQTQIDALQKTYTDARGQLVAGRGNVIRQLEEWKRKGVSASKSLPDKLVAAADEAHELALSADDEARHANEAQRDAAESRPDAD